MPPRRATMSAAQMEREIARRVADAIATHEANRASGAEGTDGGSHDATATEAAVRPCTYKDFMNCKPPSFSGTEKAVGLIRWIEKLESIFGISNCAENSKVKFATCTLTDGALTWWNSYAQSVGIMVAQQLPWEELKQKLRDEYCPSHELQQLEEELWHLKVKGNDLASYTDRFHQLAHLCPHLVNPATKKIERYIKGLPSSIQGDVTSSKPNSLQNAISMAHTLLAQIVQRGGTVEMNTTTRTTQGKRKWNNGNPSQQNEAETVKVYTAGSDSNGGYKGKLPLCNKCNRHHTGQCGILCGQCKRYGHLTKDCRSKTPANNQTTNTAANQEAPKTCFECGGIGHFKRQCANRINQNNNNPINNNARGTDV